MRGGKRRDLRSDRKGGKGKGKGDLQKDLWSDGKGEQRKGSQGEPEIPDEQLGGNRNLPEGAGRGMGVPCGGPGKPCAVKPDEQPSDGMEPERSGPDVAPEGIPEEWWEDHRPAKVSGGEKEAGGRDRKERRTGKRGEEETGGKEVRRAAAGKYPRAGSTLNEMDEGAGGPGNPIHCLMIPHRIGKKEVKGREAVLFTLEFFVCYPYNIGAMNG